MGRETLVRRLRFGQRAALVSLVVLIANVSGLAIGVSTAQAATSLPAGFVIEPVLTGLSYPTAVSFASDGRMFVAEKGGVVRVVKNGALLPTPFIDLSSDVNSNADRGLLGLTLSPNFPATPYVYVLYTYDPPGVSKDGAGARVARLERIMADPLNTDVAATGTGARTVLLGRNADSSVITDPQTTPSLTCWRNGAPVEDCIPQDSFEHAIGTVAFGPDGFLYIGNGDSDRLPNGPQDPTSLVGAILRLDPATGAGVPGNPFYDANKPNSNISKTWANGLRNPFRFSFDPVSRQMYIGDVGQDAWESLYIGQSGKNYGWPCYEGGNHVYPVFQNDPVCQPVYAQGPRVPIYTYPHTGSGGSVIAGAWYNGTSYPTAYRGAHFFADYTHDWVKTIAPNGSGGYAVQDFATGDLAQNIVQIVAGPDTDLYWVKVGVGGVPGTGAVYRLRYTSNPVLPPLVLSLGFDEGTGTVASDTSSLGNDAQLLNGATWDLGRLGGGALKLDGVNDVAAVADSSSLDGFSNAFTVSAWVDRPMTTQPGARMVVSRQLTTDAQGVFQLSFFDGEPRFGLNTIGGGTQYVGAGTALLGEWVHLAGVYDGSMMRLYVNGVLRASMAMTGKIQSSSRPILVGGTATTADPLAATQYLGGSVDEVRLYTRALSATEVAALANPGTPPAVTIVDPPGDIVVDVGARVGFSAGAADANGDDLTDQIVWTGVIHHNIHTHPDALPPTTGGSGTVVLDDHGDDMFFRLCAAVTNSVGLSATDCVDIRPRTTAVTIDSLPQGLTVSFQNTTGITPFSVTANVGGTRTLSSPLASGCYSFEGWSDGGGATHNIVVGTSPQTYTASFSGSCGSGPNLLQNPGFENGLTGWTSGAIVTSPVHLGSKALQITARSTVAVTSTQTVAVIAGTAYQASGWIDVSNIAGSAKIQVQWRNGAGTLLRTDAVGTLTGTAGWAQRSASLTAPVGATQARFVLRTEIESDGAGQAWFDDLSLLSGSGGTAGTPDYVAEGLATIPSTLNGGELVSFQGVVRNAGTAAASVSSSARLRLDINNDGTFDLTPANQTTTALAVGSVETETWSNAWTVTTGTHRLEICADVGSTITESSEANNCLTTTFTVGSSNPLNLLQNPGFENGLTGWTSGAIVTSPVHSGSKALQITARSTIAVTSTQTVAVIAGTAYQASGWIDVSNIAGSAKIQVQWRNGAGTLLRTDAVGTLTGTAGFTQRSASLTAPVGATQARFVLRTEIESDGAGQAWFDDLSLV